MYDNIAAPLSVLIVEDDPHVLLGCQQALALEDIPSEGVTTAEAALAKIAEDFAGIVISDIRLPGMDGLGLLSALKQKDATLPVVLITGHGDISMAVRAMREGHTTLWKSRFPLNAWLKSVAVRSNSAAWHAKCRRYGGSWLAGKRWKPALLAVRRPCIGCAN